MDNNAFIIACWNIQGLRSSTFGLKSRNPDFNSEIKNSDIIILQETWSRGDGPTGCPKGYRELIIPSIKLPGVTQGRDSGGMLIWYRSNIAHAINVAKTGQFYTWLEINKTVTATEKNIFLCATYIPPAESPYFNEDSFSILEEDINDFQSQGSVLLCGDLNARTGEELDTLNSQGDKHLPGGDVLHTPIHTQRLNYDKTTNKSGTHLLHLCRTLGLFLVNGRLRGDSYGRYTYSSSFGSSTVDYFLTDLNPNSLRAFTVSPLSPLSDHSKITLYLNRAMPNQEASKQTQLHSFRNMYRWKQNSKDTYLSTISQQKIQVLLDKFLATPFPHNSEGTNLAVDKLNRIFEVSATLSNLKTTQRKAKRPHATEKWFDNDCKKLRKELRILSNQKHRDADNENIRHLYHEKLKQYRNTLRKKKEQNTKIQLREIEESLESNHFWKHWNTLNKSYHQELAIQNGDVWINHFSNLFSNINKNQEQNALSDKLKVLESTIKDYQNPLDSPITLAELLDQIQNLKPQKACGVDGILNEMIRYTDHKFKLAILKLFNIILSLGIFPNFWNKGLITPIHKNGDRFDPNNYRGICVNSNLGKLFCNILNGRLGHFLRDKNVLSKCQIGFQPKYRTSDHIYTLHTLIDKQINQNKGKIFSCFVDFKKAFDSIWHEGLFLQLIQCGIGGKTYDIIKSMYTNNKFAVKIGNKHTEFLPQSRGVRQGCSLSPALFNIYINGLAQALDQSAAPGLTLLDTEVKCLLFADDLVLLSPTKEGLQQHLDLLNNFCQSWALSVNPKKTKIMIFQKRPNRQDQHHSFKLNHMPLEHTRDYTYLGINISNTGNFKKAVKDLREKARRAFYAIRRNIQIDIPIRIWLKIMKTVIEPIALYGSEVWGPLSDQEFSTWDKHPIETLQTELCKILLRVQRKTPNNACRAELGLYPLVITIQKRAIKFHAHLKSSDEQTLHHKALTYRELKPENNALGRLVLELTSQTDNKNIARPNQIIKTQKEKYLKHWTVATEKQSKLECYLALNRKYELAGYLSKVSDPKLRKVLSMYRLSEHSLSIETGRHRQTWLPKEERLCPHCTEKQLETELHFLTFCPNYKNIRDTFYPLFTTHQKDFLQLSNMDKLPLLLGESPANPNLAARYVKSCHDKRASSRTELTTL